MSNNIIKEVSIRTNGELYLGVVGSVRSGKSTFIRNFMQTKVLPYVTDENLYNKVLDELPVSSEGKTIMTVEPKFVPSNSLTINIDGNINTSVRLVDCVGYVIPSAKGYLNEDGTNRLVKTPWFQEDIPFIDAANIGTKKVIESHSNLGIVLTSDGSFGEFSRSDYQEAEDKLIFEMKKYNKPFVVVLNTNNPNDEATKKIANKIEEEHDVEVVIVDVKNMTSSDIDIIMKSALNDFEIKELSISVPEWVNNLQEDITFKKSFDTVLNEVSMDYRKMKDAFKIQTYLKDANLFENVTLDIVDHESGYVELNVTCYEETYSEVIEEIIGQKVSDKSEFIKVLQTYSKAKLLEEKVGTAIDNVTELGYSFALPMLSDMVLNEPELIKQSGRYGVKLSAKAPALQIVKVDVESSFEPIIGSLDQSLALVEHMKEEYNKNPDKLWNSEFFGRKLSDVINDGIKAKITRVPENIQVKFKDSLNKVVNDGKGGIIAIIL